jgi:hypothetical protein
MDNGLKAQKAKRKMPRKWGVNVNEFEEMRKILKRSALCTLITSVIGYDRAKRKVRI